jgi:cell division protein ZipA
MEASGNSTIDAERFSIMLDTAKQLSEGLDTYLLDDRKKPLTDACLQRYYRLLNISEDCEPSTMV